METLKEYAEKQKVTEKGLEILKHVTNNQFASIFKNRCIGATNALNSLVSYESWRNRNILYVHPNFRWARYVENRLSWHNKAILSNIWVTTAGIAPSMTRGIRYDYIIFDDIAIIDVKHNLPQAFISLNSKGTIIVNSSERDVMYDEDLLSFTLLKV